MLRQRKIHLFNCDQLYELSIIENLLNYNQGIQIRELYCRKQVRISNATCIQYNVIASDLSRIFVPGYVQKGMKDQQKLSTNVFVVNINRLM